MSNGMDVNLIGPRKLNLSVGRPNALAAALNDQEAFATTLLVIALDTFPPSEEEKQSPIYDWAPETLKLELEQEYGVKLTKLAVDKLMAAITIRSTDLFFKDPAYFVELANVLCGDDFEPDEFDPADSIECAWAVTEGLLLSPPDEEDPEPFSDEVRGYIGFVLKEEGYVTPPGILRIALDADFSPQIGEFADDPEMFQGIYQAQQDKTVEVETIMKSQLSELTTQLQQLPLQHGETVELVKRLQQSIQQKVPK